MSVFIEVGFFFREEKFEYCREIDVCDKFIIDPLTSNHSIIDLFNEGFQSMSTIREKITAGENKYCVTVQSTISVNSRHTLFSW